MLTPIAFRFNLSGRISDKMSEIFFSSIPHFFGTFFMQ
jgi:hypothetical protein